MPTIWRLQTNTDSNDGNKIASYCISNRVIAVGWSLKTDYLERKVPGNDLQRVIEERDNIHEFADYKRFVEGHMLYDGSVNGNVRRIGCEMKANDLVWLRSEGIYYIGRISGESEWKFVNNDDAFAHDAANQMSNVEWYRVGSENDVPGAIAVAFNRGYTLQRIWQQGIEEYSKLQYNETTKTEHYKIKKSDGSMKSFYSLLLPEDCEDLLCLWLFYKFGYICIPSTNKKSTELYECVLVDPESGKYIYPQVKNGQIDIDAADYRHLEGEVWLFTTFGEVRNHRDADRTIKVASPLELFDFAGAEDAQNIIPSSIKKWRAYVG